MVIDYRDCLTFPVAPPQSLGQLLDNFMKFPTLIHICLSSDQIPAIRYNTFMTAASAVLWRHYTLALATTTIFVVDGNFSLDLLRVVYTT